jgi:hypothetical protein
LSDPKIEEGLRNDLRFRRSLDVGLAGKGAGPECAVMVGCRSIVVGSGRASEAKRGGKLPTKADRQLRARGPVMRRGNIADATLAKPAASHR